MTLFIKMILKENYKKITGQVDEEGNKISSNSESDGRYHTNWLNMMYPRLRLARNLLKDDGVIFISIDDNEVENLTRICNEIFGEENKQAIITYVRKTSGKQDSSNFAKSTEYIIVYSKTQNWACKELIADDRVTNRYNKIDKDGRLYRETDLRKTGSGDRREDRPLMYYPFYFNPNANQLVAVKEIDPAYIAKGWIEILPTKPDGSDGRWRWGLNTTNSNIENLVAKVMPKYKDENKYTIYEKDYIDKLGEERTIKEHTFWDRTEFNSDNAMMEFKDLGFSNQLFPFPKCSDLIAHIINLSNSSGHDMILDFFSGSGTTAHAVMKTNYATNSNNNFILVQLPEETDEKSDAYKAGYKNICEIGKERIRRAGEKIKQEIEQENQQLKLGEEPKKVPDIGFKVLKLDSSNIKKWNANTENLEEQLQQSILNQVAGRSEIDVVYEIMLKCGLDLTYPIEEIKVEDKTLYSVGAGAMFICMDDRITQSIADKIISIKEENEIEEPVVVFKDNGFIDDSTKTNTKESLRVAGIKDFITV